MVKRGVVPALLLLIFTCGLPASAQSHEEIVVRTAYAKLAYATQIQAIKVLIEEQPAQDARAVDPAALAKAIAGAEVTFELSGFVVGDMAEIAKKNYFDLTAKPGDDQLDVAPGRWTLREAGVDATSATAQARWFRWQSGAAGANLPLQSYLAANKYDLPYTRYATFTVRMTFQGRSATYPALWLFGYDSAGTEQVLAEDNVTNKMALAHFARSSAYPGSLVDSHLRQSPALRDWLTAGQASTPGCGTTPAGARDVCCDQYTIQCGVAQDQLAPAK